MKILGRILKYLLRSVFSIIIFLLLVGWAKMNWNMNAYISFLNTTDWSVFHWSQTATRGDPFWPSTAQLSGDIADILSDDAVETEFSGLDVYDPAFEEDLNTITDSSLSGDEGIYGFSTSGEVTSDTTLS